MAFQGLPIAAGFLTIAAAQDLAGLAVSMVLLAIGTGTTATIPGAFAAEYYGTRHIGGIKAIWTSCMVLGSAVGPGITGVLIDFGYDFGVQANLIGVYFLGSATLLTLGVFRFSPVLSART